MLQHPDKQEYKEFLDELYDIYQQAVRFQKDRRGRVGRKAVVTATARANSRTVYQNGRGDRSPADSCP